MTLTACVKAADLRKRGDVETTGKLAKAIATGSAREQLVTLRDFLADQLEHAPFREVGPIAAQLRAVLADLDSMPVEKEESLVDELQLARARRLAASSTEERQPVPVLGGSGVHPAS